MVSKSKNNRAVVRKVSCAKTSVGHPKRSLQKIIDKGLLIALFIQCLHCFLIPSFENGVVLMALLLIRDIELIRGKISELNI